MTIDFVKVALKLGTHDEDAKVVWSVWKESRNVTRFSLYNYRTDREEVFEGDEAKRLYFAHTLGLPLKTTNRYLRMFPQIEENLQEYLIN